MTFVRRPGEHVTCAALQRDGKAFAVGFADGAVELVWLDSGLRSRRFTGLAASVAFVALSANGDRLFGGSESGAALVWNTHSGEVVHRLQTPGARPAGAILDTRRFSMIGGGRLSIWDCPPNAPPQARDLHTALPHVDRLAVTSDGILVLVHGFNWSVGPVNGIPHRIDPQDFDDRDLVRYAGCVRPSAGGAYLLIYWDDAAVYEVATGRRIHGCQRTVSAGDAALSNSGERIAIGSIYGRLCVHDVSGPIHVDREVTPDEIVQVLITDRGDRVLFVDLNGGFGLVDVDESRIVLTHSDLMDLSGPHPEDIR